MKGAVEAWRRYAAEGLGTFALVAVGTGAQAVSASTGAFGAAGIALVFGLVVAIVVAATGHLSGAHINPAVTVALWSARRFPSRHVVPYIAFQCCGAIAASLAVCWVLDSSLANGITLPTVPIERAFAIEAGFSGLLAFVIVAVATDERSPRGIAPFAIGAVVLCGALVAGPATGGSFNPARSLGPAVAAAHWNHLWLYWIAPMLGMVAAARTYELLRPAQHP